MHVDVKRLTIALPLAACVGLVAVVLAFAIWDCPVVPGNPCNKPDEQPCFEYCGRDCTGTQIFYSGVVIKTLTSPGPYLYQNYKLEDCHYDTPCVWSENYDNENCEYVGGDLKDWFCIMGRVGFVCKNCIPGSQIETAKQISFNCWNDS